MYKLSNNIKTDWKDVVQQEMSKDYFKSISNFLLSTNDTIYPDEKNVFNAFNYFDKKDLKVVILGQDPYHQPKQADGLAFSVSDKNAKTPPSVQNIFKELKNDLGITRTNHDLSDWAKQGVLLLNTTLTVSYNKPNSHKYIGWSNFTDNILSYINDNFDNIVFIFWGNESINKKHLVNNKKHYILTSSHPSPFSARVSFFNSKPFSKINSYLLNKKSYNINW